MRYGLIEGVKSMCLRRRLFLSACLFNGVPLSYAYGQDAGTATSGNCSPVIREVTTASINCVVGDTPDTLVARHNRLLDKIKTTTPVSFINQEMGQPSQVGQLTEDLEIISWDSLNFQLFYILEAGSPRAIGVFSRSDEPIKIPLLSWEGRSHLNELYLGEVTCDSEQVIEVDARYGFGEVSSCYEGAGGSYLNWEFVFTGFPKCIGYDSWSLSSLAEEGCARRLTPSIAIAHLDEGNDEDEFWSTLRYARLVSDFYFWGH